MRAQPAARSGAFLVGAAASVLACVGLSGAAFPEPRTRPDTPDQRLERFNLENPQCRLWTDWQRACARTGLGGAMRCVTDRSHPVAPSEPFCVATPFWGRPGPFTDSQRLSSLRFCRSTYRERVTDAAGRLLYEERVCGRYERDRPFNGRTVAARRHPLCARWSRGPAGVLICAKWRRAPCRLLDNVPRQVPADNESTVVIPHRFDPDRMAVLSVTCES